MKAPKYAYIQDADGNFFKVVVTDGQLVSVYAPDPIIPHLVGCFVARYFKGSKSEGGYSTTAENMKSRVMFTFLLDDLMDVAVKNSDGTVKVVGFVGAVAKGGRDEYHNMEKRGSGITWVKGSRELVLLNDAGLNIKPRLTFEAQGQWANWIRWRVTVSAGPYGTVDSGSFEADYFNVSGALLPAKAGEEKVTVFDFIDSTDDPAMTGDGMLKYNQGYNVACSAEATNEEGTIRENLSFAAKERVLCPRDIIQTFPSEPESIDDINGAVDYDMYESDIALVKAFTPGPVSSARVKLYTAPSGSKPPEMQIPLPAGWYHSSYLDGDYIKAMEVDGTGMIIQAKEIRASSATNPVNIGLSILLGTDRTDSDCYALEYSLSVSDPAGRAYKVEITGASGSNSTTHYAMRMRTGPSESDTAYYAETNVWGESDVLAITLITADDDGEIAADNTHVIRGIGKERNQGSEWLLPLGRNPEPPASGDVNEVYTQAIDSYCKVYRWSGSSWERITNFALPTDESGVHFNCTINPVNTNHKI